MAYIETTSFLYISHLPEWPKLDILFLIFPKLHRVQSRKHTQMGNIRKLEIKTKIQNMSFVNLLEKRTYFNYITMC